MALPLERCDTNLLGFGVFVNNREKTMSEKKRVALVGSGNWGSAVARIIGKNVEQYDTFEKTVPMWVFEEMVDGRKLSEIINEEHVNTKYLPGIKLPENVIANPDIVETVKGADILVFVVPHQFVKRICDQIKDHVKPGAFGISLIKGVDISKGGLDLVSHLIEETLKMNVSVLMGANIAKDVAQDLFCEATIGCKDDEKGKILHQLFHTPFFNINVVKDTAGVEICGALKNIVAVAAGFCDGLEYGESTKAAVIRLGLVEMLAFSKLYYAGVEMATFMESCGVADLIATCYGGRNRKVAEALVKTGKPIEVLEAEMLNGQKLQGPLTAKEVYTILEKDGHTEDFRLFSSVYKVCYEGAPAQDILKMLSKL